MICFIAVRKFLPTLQYFVLYIWSIDQHVIGFCYKLKRIKIFLEKASKCSIIESFLQYMYIRALAVGIIGNWRTIYFAIRKYFDY